MDSNELSEMTTAISRIAPEISVTDIPSACKTKRVLCATLPPGLKFRATGENVLEVRYRPGEGREELAKRELLRQAGQGVHGQTGTYRRKLIYDASRYFKRIAFPERSYG